MYESELWFSSKDWYEGEQLQSSLYQAGVPCYAREFIGTFTIYLDIQ